MRSNLVRTTIALLVSLSLAAACGTTDSTNADSTPSVRRAGATNPAATAPYARKGPYDVGFTTLALDDGSQVLVWYPAKPGHHPASDREVIDLTASLRPDLLAKVPPADRVVSHADAYRQAAPAAIEGGAPLVLYAHPYAGTPDTATSLTTHLASWGFVVAAPELLGHSLAGLFGTAAEGVSPKPDAAVLGATLDLVTAAGGSPGVLHQLVDPSHVSVLGFSLGAGSAYQFASDPRVEAWISQGVQFGGQMGPQPPTPHKPGMIMEAQDDTAAPPQKSQWVYGAMDEPKVLVKIYDAAHEVFADTCMIGAPDHRLVDVVTDLKLFPDALAKLVLDGCRTDLPPASEAQAAIGQTTVAFLRWTSGIDPKPVGLTTAAVARLGTPTTIIRN